MKYFEKNEFIKEKWGGRLLNFEGSPGVPLLNFEGGPSFQVPWSRSQGPGPTFTPCPQIWQKLLQFFRHVSLRGIPSQKYLFIRNENAR